MTNSAPSLEIVPSSGGEDLADRSDVELDLLPYGVICLDRDGVVIRYNRVEARFARLDRSVVLGKAFFGVVAPCTATPEFEGRFRTFLEDPRGPATLTFSYVFAFRFGAQEVDVELRRTRSADRVYLCIGRRKFRASLAGPEVPGGDRPAAVMSELAPEEKRQGVVRDVAERRNVVLDSRFFEAFSEVPGFDAHAEALGSAWGRRIAGDLEIEALESFDGPLRDLPIVTIFEMVTRYVRGRGLGNMLADLEHAPSGLLVFQLERSLIAEAAAPSESPRCRLVSGFLSAILTHVAGKPMSVREAACRAAGHATCDFYATGGIREEMLERAIRSAGPDAAAVARTLRGAS